MKPFIMAVLVLSSFTTIAQTKTDSFKVYGNCGMCEKRIEKAVRVEGVASADWNVDSKIMEITYDAAKISNDQLQQKIAGVGHDTEKYMADNKVYNNLPGCCLYERRKVNDKPDHPGPQHK